MKSDREQYAEEEARQFVQTMRKAAFTNEEILTAVNNVLEEKNKQ